MHKVSPGASRFIKLILGSFIIATFTLVNAHARGPVHLDKIQRDGYGIVELRQPEANEFFMETALNGHPIRLILDTGFCASHIVVSNGCAKFLRVAPHPVKSDGYAISGGQIKDFREGVADLLKIGNVQVSGTTINLGALGNLKGHTIGGVWLTDGTLGNARRANVDSDGYLSLGFLRTCSAIIDLANRRLYLKPPHVGRNVDMGPLLKSIGFSEANFEATDNGLIIDASVNGVPTKMIIDTGAYLTTIDSRYAAQAKLKTYRSNVRMQDASGAEFYPDEADPDTFQIDGKHALRTKLVVQPMSSYAPTGGRLGGLLGTDFLGQSWSIIDVAQHKLYFGNPK